MPAVRWAAAGANVAGLALAVGFLIIAGWRAPQGLLLLTLFATGLVCALQIGSSSRQAR